jgi:signal transduction histidine kinase
MQVEDEILVAEMRVVFRTPMGLLTSLINGAFCVAVLWRAIPPSLLLGWALALALCLGARLLLWRAYRTKQPKAADAGRWIGWFTAGAALTGALWGTLATVIVISDDPLYHSFATMVLAGMAAGAVAAFAPCRPALYAFLAPLGLPLAAVLVLHGGGIYLAMSAMVLVFLTSVGVIASGLNRSFVSSVRLSMEKTELADELRAARDSAEQVSRAKSQSLTSMSHELRTPLNAIIGFSEVIRDAMLEPLGERYRDYARDIHHSGRHLLKLINNVLDLAKIETGRFDLREEKVDVAGLVATCLPIIDQLAKNGGVDLRVSLIPDLPFIWADELRLKQIVLNLLGNAVKFTPSGGRVTIAAAHSRDGGVTIRVTDTGIGIRPEDIPVALEPFRQIEAGLSRRYEGAGLGLPLSKQLIELHGGALTIESQLGKGTTVYVSVPPSRVIRAAA